MKILDKLKNALFEEDEEDEVEIIKEKKPKEEKKEKRRAIVEEKREIEEPADDIVKKVDVEKTYENTNQNLRINNFDMPEEKKSPIIFDDEDFLSDTKEISFEKTPTKEEKVLYGGKENIYEPVQEKPKTRFRPSPVISPVYGVLKPEYSSDNKNDSRKSLDELFADDKQKNVTFDEIRHKAYGESYSEPEQAYEEEKPKTLLYDMQEKDTPGIEKITLGDAEDYYNDLGLEYEVDYKDESKKKATRISKNKSLSDELDLENTIEIEKVKANVPVEKPVEASTPKVKAKPKTAKEIKKAKAFCYDDEDDDTPEEKNLYDIIDMMYDSKK